MLEKSKKVTITIPERCSMDNLGYAVIQAAGENPAEISCYCPNLIVSRDIYNAFKLYMKRQGWTEFAADGIWDESGPSINESFVGGEVEIQDALFEISSDAPEVRPPKAKPPKGAAGVIASCAFITHAVMMCSASYFKNSLLAVPFQALDVFSLFVISLGGTIWFGSMVDKKFRNKGIK